MLKNNMNTLRAADYKESSSVFNKNTYFQRRLSIQYVKLRKNVMALIVVVKIGNSNLHAPKRQYSIISTQKSDYAQKLNPEKRKTDCICTCPRMDYLNQQRMDCTMA